MPCRKSTPHLIELFKKYNKAGLDIIAVADDDENKAAWTKAITRDSSSNWVNVLRGRNSIKKEQDILAKFSVHLLPTTILIDKDGMIIGKYTGTLETEALDKKLADVFKKKLVFVPLKH